MWNHHVFHQPKSFLLSVRCACAWRGGFLSKVTQASQQNESAQTTSKEKSITKGEKSRGKQRPGGQSETDHM